MRTFSLMGILFIGCSDSPAPQEPAPTPEPTETVAPAAEQAPVDAVVAEEAPAEEPVAEAAAAAPDGGAIYNTYCITCHQADGRGMNGTMAGNFVEDKERLAKSDEELINSITNGFTGPIGAMPAWGAVLNEEQIAAVLAYVRTTYGE